MKVYIGPYVNWIGPYQIADMIFFWLDKWVDEETEKRWDYKLHERMSEWLAKTWVNDVCQWIHDKKKRKVEIKIDGYDIWSADHTLSLIAVPLLKKLKERMHGSPYVDDEDVPEELRSTAAPPKENEWDTDENHHKRWEWVLGEMIWAHEQIADEDHCAWSETEEERERIKKGFYLFGKYYQSLWD
jgi:hypothetical protein